MSLKIYARRITLPSSTGSSIYRGKIKGHAPSFRIDSEYKAWFKQADQVKKELLTVDRMCLIRLKSRASRFLRFTTLSI